MYQNALPQTTFCPKWPRMKPLHRGFQRCIDFEHSMIIIALADIHRFGGYFLSSLQHVVVLLIPVVARHRLRPRSPWCTAQATHPKWLRMKPLHMGFQRYIDFELSVSIRVVAEVRDAWFWLFWHQYNIHELWVQNKFLDLVSDASLWKKNALLVFKQKY